MPHSIMFELSHKARIGMMRLAAERPVRHREIMLGSGLAPSEVTRHVGRLMDIGVLKKKMDGTLVITGFGKMMLNSLDSMDFVTSNRQFFENHELGAIPPGFDAVSMLRGSERIEGLMNVFNAVLQINLRAHIFINCMQAEFSDALIITQVEKLRSGVEVNMLVRGGKRLPTEYVDSRGTALSVKALDTLPFFYMASEAEVLVCFNGPGEKIDYSVAFRSGETAFMEWCDVLFSRHWSRARNIIL